MNISFIRLKSVITALRGIERQLERMADCWEVELSEKGYNMRPPKADTSGPEPTMVYTNEEDDFAREFDERLRRQDELLNRDDV